MHFGETGDEGAVDEVLGSLAGHGFEVGEVGTEEGVLIAPGDLGEGASLL